MKLVIIERKMGMKRKGIFIICNIIVLAISFCFGCGHKQSKQEKNSEDRVLEEKYQTDSEGKIIVPEEEFIKQGATFNMKEVSQETTANFCWTYEFEDRDYDADGLYDEVFVTRNEEGTIYIIQFGNGDVLNLGPFGEYDIGFYIESADIDQDGDLEILYLGSHMTGTKPWSEIIISKKGNSGYEFMEMMKCSNVERNSEWSIGTDLYVIDINIEERKVTIGNNMLNIYNDFIINSPNEYEESIENQLDCFKRAYNDEMNLGGEAWTARFLYLKDKAVLEIRVPIEISHMENSKKIIPYRDAVVRYIYEEEKWVPIEINIVEGARRIWWN